MKVRDQGTSISIEERIVPYSGRRESFHLIDFRVDVMKKSGLISACSTGEMSVPAIDKVISCLQLAKRIARGEIEFCEQKG